ncbi:hypothetical protein HYS31_00120 [Candidatus Woesearchaeota archaeon]|nr:hypothetical protein [Candidatus Woesearchaeota archaeon]
MINVPAEAREIIEKEISSKENITGIDPRWTHVIVIHKLMEIEKRLDAIERKL